MRIIALDVGKRRIGIAVSDPLGVTARPYSTIERDRHAPEKITVLVRELQVGKILVGLPLHLDGSEGTQAQDVRRFAAKLAEAATLVPIEFRDERLTTVEAQQRLSDRHRNLRKNKKKIDAVAACILLEEYLLER